MSVKIVLTPYEDPATGVDWPEQTPIVIKRLQELLCSYPGGEVEYRIKETNHGIGADWPTITLELLGIASVLFFAIPALHKKIRETLTEWKTIKKELDSFCEWLIGKEPVFSYSIEKAFLDALGHLESKTNILELELIEAIQIPGKSGAPVPGFETSPRLYYLFLFREDNEHAYVLLLDSESKMVVYKSLGLDPRYAGDE